MGQGRDMAGAPEEMAQMLDDFKDQLFIVMLKRLGGSVQIPISEADDTGGQVVAMGIDTDAGVFNFEVREKQ